jgi:hypothetical protein
VRPARFGADLRKTGPRGWRSTLTRALVLEYPRYVRRFVALATVLFVAAFLTGYGAGSRRASSLETFLDRLTLEHDGLRALAAEQSYRLDQMMETSLSGIDSAEVGRLRDDLDRTVASLNEARAKADENSRLIEEHRDALSAKDVALSECSAVQSRLEEQLEICIFEKASLERHASANSPGRPVSGVSPVHQSLEFPAAGAGR